MTESIKGSRSPLPAPTPSSDKPRREPTITDGQAPALDKVTTRSLEEAAKGVETATDEVREIEREADLVEQSPPTLREAPRADRGGNAQREVSRNESSVGDLNGESRVSEINVQPAEPPIRSPEEATRVAERVSREIVANPPQALAVNINVAAVRALFT